MRFSLALTVLALVGCARDQVLFSDPDGGADAPGATPRTDGAPSAVPVVTPRLDMGLAPDAGARVVADCERACRDYVGCGINLQCNQADADWLEQRCLRACVDTGFAEGVLGTPNCQGAVDLAHEASAVLASACDTNARVCEGYADHLTGCVADLCGDPQPNERLRDAFVSACLDGIAGDQISEADATGLTATPCVDTDLNRALQALVGGAPEAVCGTSTDP